MIKFKICEDCKDPTYCFSIIGTCEIQDDKEIEKLEDNRQSEDYYKGGNNEE